MSSRYVGKSSFCVPGCTLVYDCKELHGKAAAELWLLLDSCSAAGRTAMNAAKREVHLCPRWHAETCLPCMAWVET